MQQEFITVNLQSHEDCDPMFRYSLCESCPMIIAGFTCLMETFIVAE